MRQFAAAAQQFGHIWSDEDIKQGAELMSNAVFSRHLIPTMHFFSDGSDAFPNKLFSLILQSAEARLFLLRLPPRGRGKGVIKIVLQNSVTSVTLDRFEWLAKHRGTAPTSPTDGSV